MRGTVADLPHDAQYDAAICIFVLHFLSDAEKLALLRGVLDRLQPEAPLLVATAARMTEEHERLRDDLLGTWQEHGELMSVPADRMAAIIAQLLPSQQGMSTAQDHVRLLQEAGFKQVGELLRVMSGAVCAWIAR